MLLTGLADALLEVAGQVKQVNAVQSVVGDGDEVVAHGDAVRLLDARE